MNLSSLASWDASVEVSPQSLVERRLISKSRRRRQDSRRDQTWKESPVGIEVPRRALLAERARRARRGRREPRRRGRSSRKLRQGVGLLQNLRQAMLVPDIRRRILFVLCAFALFVFMIHVQLPDVDHAKWQSLAYARRVLPVPRLPLGRRAAEALDHRDGDHALHQRLDHHAVDDGGLPATRGDGQERRRGRP